MSVRSFIDINQYSFNKGKKTATLCYPGMCGSMGATIKWAHKYAKLAFEAQCDGMIAKNDADFALQVLDNAVKENERVRNVIKRFNRRFG
jgi:hypothetical protein